MRRLLYIGHKFHIRTGSTRFLTDLLAKHFILETLAIDPDSEQDRERALGETNADLVVILQKDYLAPAFLAQGKPTVVIPMLDGSGDLPSLHWEISNQARFVSFSRKLHVTIQRAGGSSLLVKFFPEVPADAKPRNFDHIDAFFWQRRPEHGLDLPLVLKLIGSQVRTLYFHDAPDVAEPGKGKNRWSKRIENRINIVRSEWFRNQSDYTRVLAKANLFVAPRMAEGIGMGFLEAMGHGMVVIAHDAGTHNEYICDGINGILFSMQTPLLDLDRDALTQISGQARQTIIDGREKWNASIPELIDFIETTPKPDPRGVDPRVLSRELPKAYYAGAANYASYLRRNLGVVRKLSPALDDRRAVRKRETVFAGGTEAAYEALSGNRIDFGMGRARPFLLKGWSVDEDSLVWMIERGGSINFAVKSEFMGLSAIKFRARCSPSIGGNTHTAIVLNGTFAGAVEIGHEHEEFTLAIPEPGLLHNNVLQIFSDQIGGPLLDPRPLTVAFYYIEFM
jgi:Glycosyl transferases group 1